MGEKALPLRTCINEFVLVSPPIDPTTRTRVLHLFLVLYHHLLYSLYNG